MWAGKHAPPLVEDGYWPAEFDDTVLPRAGGAEPVSGSGPTATPFALDSFESLLHGTLAAASAAVTALDDWFQSLVAFPRTVVDHAAHLHAAIWRRWSSPVWSQVGGQLSAGRWDDAAHTAWGALYDEHPLLPAMVCALLVLWVAIVFVQWRFREYFRALRHALVNL